MLRPVLLGAVGLWVTAGLVSAPAAAGDCCDCGYVVRGYSAYDPAPRAYGYYYEPRVLYRRFHPRWQYSAAYYNSPLAYGYVSRGPAVLVRPYRRWHRW